MFYIGFRDTVHGADRHCPKQGWNHGLAASSGQPHRRVRGKDQWDEHACYKPYAVYDGRKWLLWYNGRRMDLEQIGVAMHEGEDLGFDQPAAAGYSPSTPR